MIICKNTIKGILLALGANENSQDIEDLYIAVKEQAVSVIGEILDGYVNDKIRQPIVDLIKMLLIKEGK